MAKEAGAEEGHDCERLRFAAEAEAGAGTGLGYAKLNNKGGQRAVLRVAVPSGQLYSAGETAAHRQSKHQAGGARVQVWYEQSRFIPGHTSPPAASGCVLTRQQNLPQKLPSCPCPCTSPCTSLRPPSDASPLLPTCSFWMCAATSAEFSARASRLLTNPPCPCLSPCTSKCTSPCVSLRRLPRPPPPAASGCLLPRQQQLL